MEFEFQIFPSTVLVFKTIIIQFCLQVNRNNIRIMVSQISQ